MISIAIKDYSNEEIEPLTNYTNIYIKIPYSTKSDVYVIALNGNVLNNYDSDSNNFEISIGNLSAGIYLLKIVTNNDVLIEKFIKQ